MTEFCRRLIETDLPIARISEPARQEKRRSARAHVWWSWKPLSASRAEIFAAVVPDPSDSRCPSAFRARAAIVLQKLRDEIGGPQRDLANPEGLKTALLDLVGSLAEIEADANSAPLAAARELIGLIRASKDGVGGDTPLLLADPFAGSGSIPLEASRLGLAVFSSDLNPVAVLLEEAYLIHAPRLGDQLRPLLEVWGKRVYESVEKQLHTLYPANPEGKPIAYLWLREIRCTGPGCGARIPLASKVWLSKVGREYSLKFRPSTVEGEVDVEVQAGPPTGGSKATVRLGSATCPLCDFTTPKTLVREQLAKDRGGADSARLVAVVLSPHGSRGRIFVKPSAEDLAAIRKAKELSALLSETSGAVSRIPDEPIPHERVWKNNPIRVHLYGMATWGDLFSSRQAVAMDAFVSAVRELPELMGAEGIGSETATSVTLCLALAVDRLADHLNSLCAWNPSGPKLQHLFGQQAVPIIWDFAEANPFGDSVGDWMHGVECVIKGLSKAVGASEHATVLAVDATEHPLPDDSVDLVVTDPPYYDQVPYATLSEFFYVWLKRSLPPDGRGLFTAIGTPKAAECVVDDARGKDREFFERTMRKALAEAHRIIRPDGIAIIIFAHKSTSGWEALLQALIDAGWIVTASWPLNTELETRLRAQDSATLGSSIHIVCRPRKNQDGSVAVEAIGDWRDILAELPDRIHSWMPRLAQEGIVGADAIFACLGPALEIFSRYSSVEKASGESVRLTDYLEEVWAAVSREALGMIFEAADVSGFEEDAGLTAMWLWTLHTRSDVDGGRMEAPKSVRGYRLEYDAARKISQGLGAHLESLGHLVEVKGDTATLLSAAARTNYLFGRDEVEVPQSRGKQKEQLALNFDEEIEKLDHRGGDWAVDVSGRAGGTVLDRLHQTMILFGAGRSAAIRRLLVDDGVGRDPLFWRLAQALSALYPVGTDEKRWIDGVLARKKGLGL